MTEKKEEMSMTAKADAAFRLAASEVIQRAKQTDTPIIVWEEGRIKEIPADQFELATEESNSNASESDE